MLAGFGPRWLDNALILVFDTLRSFPTVMFALAIVTLIGFLGLRIPGALAFALGWTTLPFAPEGVAAPLYGAWLAMIADVFLRAILTTWRFLHGGWQRARV